MCTTNERREITLDVQGMTCATCAQRVSGALRAVDGVLDVQVQVREGRATVSHSGASTDALIHALERVGYTAAQAA